MDTVKSKIPLITVLAYFFDRYGRWSDTLEIDRPAAIFHTDAADYYLQEWTRQRPRLKQGESIVVFHPTNQYPVPVLIKGNRV